MTIGFRAIVQAAESHALELGVFDRVGRHEPASAPGNGISAAIWVDQVRPDPTHTGLAASSIVVVLNVRMVSSLLSEPADDIDVNLMDALDALFNAYTGDFTLGGLISHIDLLGRSRVESLRAEAGYVDQGDQTYRMFLAYVPCVIDDVWAQEPT